MATQRSSKLRVMVDANVLVSGIGWPRFAYAVLQHGVAGDFHVVLSEYVIDEARTHIARLFPDLVGSLETFLRESTYEPIAVPSPEDLAANRDLVRDIKDVPVVLSAMNAAVDYLVSSDKDLTAPDEPIHQQLKILLPGTFLREHMNWTSEELEAIRTHTWKDLES